MVTLLPGKKKNGHHTMGLPIDTVYRFNMQIELSYHFHMTLKHVISIICQGGRTTVEWTWWRHPYSIVQTQGP